MRENQTGLMGSFETDIQVPDFKKTPLKLSSIVLASQQTQNAKASKHDPTPLIRDGVAWVPNVPHVFRQDQHLYVLYEVYDPAKNKAAPSGKPLRVLTSIEFLKAGTKVYETPLVEADTLNVPERGAVAFQFDVPLAQLKPGPYPTQVNVIDDAGGSFSFPRAAIFNSAARRSCSNTGPCTGSVINAVFRIPRHIPHAHTGSADGTRIAAAASPLQVIRRREDHAAVFAERKNLPAQVVISQRPRSSLARRGLVRICPGNASD